MNSQAIFFYLSVVLLSNLSLVKASENAVAILKGNGISGWVSFTQDANDVLQIKVNITGLPTGIGQKNHGIHVHTFGIVDPSDNVTIKCGSSGTHYNPFSLTHGDINDLIRHVGDYGNVVSDNNGIISTSLSDKVSKLSGPFNIIGRTVVLHQLEDDLGRGGNPDSKLTGNSGARIACGVIGLSP